jgi:hypothetical protein
VTMRCARGSFRIKANRSAVIRARLSTACMRLLDAQPQHRLPALYSSQAHSAQVGQRKRLTLVIRPPATTRRRA